jgi:glycosyltransferase involved in cell wall biosynthesis
MRILLIHQFLWSHYKAGIFTELENLFKKNPSNDLYIIQTAKFEKSRLDFGEADSSIHTYNYELLFDDIYENTRYIDRVKKVYARLKKFKPTIITLPGYYEPAMVTVQFIAKLLGIKVILAVDSTEGDNPNKWYAELIKKFIISFADGFFCYGKKSADYMLKLGASESQILMRRNSVNNTRVREIYDAYKISEDYKYERKKYPKYNFIFVGRFLEIKNLDRLINSFNLAKNDDWGLILVGDGPEKEKLITLQKSINNLYFIPPQEWYKVPEKMALADVLILPSYSEPWGLVANEAMVCGMPVIVSKQSGSSTDLVKEGLNGFTFDAYLEEELITGMKYFIDKPYEVKAMGEKSIEIIKNFSPQNVAKEMYEGYSLISN